MGTRLAQTVIRRRLTKCHPSLVLDADLKSPDDSASPGREPRCVRCLASHHDGIDRIARQIEHDPIELATIGAVAGRSRCSGWRRPLLSHICGERPREVCIPWARPRLLHMTCDRRRCCKPQWWQPAIRVAFASNKDPIRLVASIPTPFPRSRQQRLSYREQSLQALSAATNRNKG
jgi:hypothetical protein